MITIGEQQLEKAVFRAPGLVILHFGVPSLGASFLLSQRLEELQILFDQQFACYFVDTEKSSEVLKTFNIAQLPSLLFMKNGAIIDQLEGSFPKIVIENKIHKILKSAQ